MLLASTLPAPAAPRTSLPSSKSASPKPASTAPAAEKKSSSPIDTSTVRRYYMEGDFDPAIDILETALRYKSGFSKEDSLFIFKHLGVMYTAKYETREKGKRYMYRLLEVDPTARILDMYASDMIYMIFKNIKDEFDASHHRQAQPDSAANVHPVHGAVQEKAGRSGKSSSSTFFWVGVTAAVVVAGGAAAYFLHSDEPIVNDNKPD